MFKKVKTGKTMQDPMKNQSCTANGIVIVSKRYNRVEKYDTAN